MSITTEQQSHLLMKYCTSDFLHYKPDLCISATSTVAPSEKPYKYKIVIIFV